MAYISNYITTEKEKCTPRPRCIYVLKCQIYIPSFVLATTINNYKESGQQDFSQCLL